MTGQLRITRTEEVMGATVTGGSRPGHPSREVGPETVREWVDEVVARGFRTVVCLLSDEQLGFYEGLGEGGLIGAYEARGLAVRHYPVEDYDSPPVPTPVLQQIQEDFPEMAPPVLVHCSAGVDRTGAVLDWLATEV